MKKQFIMIQTFNDYGKRFENIAIDQITRIIDDGLGHSIICLTDGDSVTTPQSSEGIISAIEMIQDDEDGDEDENDD